MAIDLMHLLGSAESDECDETFELTIFDNQMDDDFFGPPICLIYAYIRTKCGASIYHLMPMDVALLCGSYIGVVDTRTKLKMQFKEIIDDAGLLDQCMCEYKQYDTSTQQIKDLLRNNCIMQTKNLMQVERNKILNWERNANSMKVIEFNNLICSFQRAINRYSNSLNALFNVFKKILIRNVQIFGAISVNLTDDEIEALIFEKRHDDYASFFIQTFTNTFGGIIHTEDSFIDNLARLEHQYDQMVAISENICEITQLYQELNVWIIDQTILTEYDENEFKKLRIMERKMKIRRQFRYICLLLTLLIIMFVVIFAFA